MCDLLDVGHVPFFTKPTDIILFLLPSELCANFHEEYIEELCGEDLDGVGLQVFVETFEAGSELV